MVSAIGLYCRVAGLFVRNVYGIARKGAIVAQLEELLRFERKRDWDKPRRTAVGILGVPAEAPGDHLSLSLELQPIYSVTKKLEFLDMEDKHIGAKRTGTWKAGGVVIFINCSWVVTRWQYTFTHKQYTEQPK
jgi:hypothetical protein